jgi:hypothetical protein
MQDEPDPPRKFYGFKPREFERANSTPTPPPSGTPAPDPAIAPTNSGKIDVRELVRAGAGEGRQLGNNAIVNRANEIHAILRANLARDIAAGHYDLGPLDDSKRRRRIRNYWLALAAVDLPFGAFAWWAGHSPVIPLVVGIIWIVSAIAGIAIFTTWLTWQTFFLRTHY